MKKQETIKIIQELKKKGKQEKQKIYLAIAKNLSKPRKNQARINLWRLSKLSEKNNGKKIVVCGKILGNGNASPKINVYAFEASEKAVEKITKAEGKINTLQELVKEKNKELVLVK